MTRDRSYVKKLCYFFMSFNSFMVKIKIFTMKSVNLLKLINLINLIYSRPALFVNTSVTQ